MKRIKGQRNARARPRIEAMLKLKKQNCAPESTFYGRSLGKFAKEHEHEAMRSVARKAIQTVARQSAAKSFGEEQIRWLSDVLPKTGCDPDIGMAPNRLKDAKPAGLAKFSHGGQLKRGHCMPIIQRISARADNT